jgi:hypothetical protein
MKELVAILARALLWAVGVSAMVFAVFFIGPMMIGGSPLGAFLLAPTAFPPALFVASVLQYRRALRLDGAAKAAYLVVLALVLIPAVPAARFLATLDLSINTTAYSREQRLLHAAPMTDDERRLRESTHFDLRVRVENPRFPPVYAEALVTDLGAIGLFRTVDERVTPETADLVATVTGQYYGDKTGQSFTLRRADGRASAVQLRVYYTVGGIFSAMGDRRQYLDRLAVEVIRSVETLQTGTP